MSKPWWAPPERSRSAASQLPPPPAIQAASDGESGTSRDAIASGVTWVSFSIGMGAGGQAVGKLLVERYSAVQLLAIRSWIGLAILAPTAWRRGIPPLGRAVFVRVVASAATHLLLFSALRDLPLANVMAIFFAAPLFATVLSGPFLGERVSPGRWVAVLVGFGGVVLILRPAAGGVEPGALLALGASLCYPVNVIVVRRVRATESTFSLVFWQYVGQAFAFSVALPFVWRPVDAGDWATFLVLAALMLPAQYGFLHGLKKIPIVLIASLEYTTLFWAALLDFAIWGNAPAASVWLGGGLIMVSGIYCASKTRAAPPAPVPG